MNTTSKVSSRRRRRCWAPRWCAGRRRPRCPKRHADQAARRSRRSSPQTGGPISPVVTLNGWTLPWRMNNGVEGIPSGRRAGRARARAGHDSATCGATTASARPDDRSASKATSCASSSPTGCRSTPRSTGTASLLPNGMDGVGGLTQPHIRPGKTFVYEFKMRKSGTFMYHPHADEMVQMAMGMMGFIIVHPKNAKSAASIATSSS